MLLSEKNWKMMEPKPHQETEIDDLPTVSPMAVTLLKQRGITTKEEAIRFLSPKLEHLHNPYLLANMEKAISRVQQAILNREKILVYGDYDADGVTATALMMKVLAELGAHASYYIPNRFTEGYGPNEQAFRKAHENGVSLIITVDTGIAAIHEAEVAKALGIDLIITDHHDLQDELPDAYAIINPKASPDYPFQELAGVGVALKFAECLLGYLPKHLLDLVAVGTIADLVPLLDENRVLAYYGLQTLSQTANLGLKALCRVSGIEGDVNEQDVGFSIGPRINAVGRLQSADLVVKLLLTEDPHEAVQLADMVNELNEERKALVDEIVKEAESMLDLDDETRLILVAHPDWNEGVLGIVASRLVKRYDRPAIVLKTDEATQMAKGSARSIPAFNLFRSCMKVRELFAQFGGHSQAAGMSLPIENIEPLKQALELQMRRELKPEDYKHDINLSGTLDISEITETLVEDIAQLAPFGVGNPKPVFRICGHVSDVRQIGLQKNHLKLKISDESQTIDSIGFQMGDLYHYMTPKTVIEMAGELGINEWNGFKQVQFMIHDVQIKERQIFDLRGQKDKDIRVFAPDDKTSVIITNDHLSFKEPELRNIMQISYEVDLTQVKPKNNVFIYSLPPELKIFEQMIQVLNPVNIHLCYDIDDSFYFKSMLNRETFKDFYILMLKQKQFDLHEDLPLLMQAKGWSKQQIMFMVNVFLELQFVQVEHHKVKIIPNPIKKDLQESTLYQQYMERIEIEKTLYYSTYESIKQWFENCLARNEHTGKEVRNGLQRIY